MSGNLSHSPADIVRYAIIDLGEGVRPSVATRANQWPVYVNQEPDQPDSCMTVFDTAGRQDGRSMVDGTRYEKPGVQIRLRTRGANTGWDKLQDVAVALDALALAYVSIGSTQYVLYNFSRTTNVLSIGKEDTPSKRDLFTVNAIVTLRQLS